MAKSIKKNYIYNAIYQVLVLLTPLITTPYVSRVLSANGIGQYSYSASIVSYFTLAATFGTTMYGQREISYLQNDRNKRSKIFWEIEILSCIFVLISIIVFLLMMSLTGFQLIYLVQIFTILAVATDVSWLYTGMEDFRATVTRNMVFKIINIAFIFIFVRSKNDLIIYVLGLSFIQFLSTLSYWPTLQQYVDFRVKDHLMPFKHFIPDFALFIPTVAIQVYTVLDKTMIGMITHSAVENGYYEQATKISKITLTLVTSLGTVMVPRIGAYFAAKDKDKIDEYMYKAYRFVWMLGIPLCFGLIGISQNFVPWFFGKGFEKCAGLINILSFLILAIGINNVTGIQYLIPTKRQNIFTFTVCLGAIVNFIFNSLMIPQLASYGAALASVLAETVIAVSQLIIIRTELSGWKIIKLIPKYLISGLLMLGCLLAENKFMAASIVHTVIMIASGAIIYALMLFILRDQFFIQNVNQVFNKVKARL